MDNASRHLPAPVVGPSRLLPLLLVVAAAVVLATGLALPVVELRRFLMFTERHALIGIVVTLMRDGEWFLGSVLGAVSVVLPALKLAAMSVAAAAIAAGRRPMPAAMYSIHHLGRWSMLDVLVVALVVFAVKRSGLAGAAALPGISLFALSVMMSIAAAWLIERETQRT